MEKVDNAGLLITHVILSEIENFGTPSPELTLANELDRLRETIGIETERDLKSIISGRNNEHSVHDDINDDDGMRQNIDNEDEHRHDDDPVPENDVGFANVIDKKVNQIKRLCTDERINSYKADQRSPVSLALKYRLLLKFDRFIRAHLPGTF